ncbi:MAG: flagellar protein FlaG [Thiohalomonadaceae bacterium]
MPIDTTYQLNTGQATRPAPAVQTSGAFGVEQRVPEKTAEQVNNQTQANTAQIKPEQLEKAVQQVASQIQSFQRNLNFSIDEDSGRTVIKVIDSSTDEVIRQIPSEEMLALARQLGEIDNTDLSKMNSDDLSGLLMQFTA